MHAGAAHTLKALCRERAAAAKTGDLNQRALLSGSKAPDLARQSEDTVMGGGGGGSSELHAGAKLGCSARDGSSCGQVSCSRCGPAAEDKNPAARVLPIEPSPFEGLAIGSRAGCQQQQHQQPGSSGSADGGGMMAEQHGADEAEMLDVPRTDATNLPATASSQTDSAKDMAGHRPPTARAAAVEQQQQGEARQKPAEAVRQLTPQEEKDAEDEAAAQERWAPILVSTLSGFHLACARLLPTSHATCILRT